MTQEELINKSIEILSKVFMKYDTMGKRAVNIGGGIKITATNVNTIEAIGKDIATTVTSLSEYFNITKGAVSQIITKLEKEEYVRRENGVGKIVNLKLTAKGKKALKYHEQYTKKDLIKFITLMNKYNLSQVETFLEMMNDLDLVIGEILKEQRNKSN